ncbi:hypothetical protein BGZ49_005552 [Haplosporangium sp. Z 27]|nr:hypothetical protein BGZ49_005552 [Haplosporangium sp. Z 27]
MSNENHEITLAPIENRAETETKLQELLAEAYRQLIFKRAVDFNERESEVDNDLQNYDLEEPLEEESGSFTDPSPDETLSIEESDRGLHGGEDSLYKVFFDRPEDKISTEQQIQSFITAESVALCNKKMILDSLLSNFAIHEAGDAVGRTMSDRLVENPPGFLTFWVQDDMFELWLEEHSNFIGTKFTPDKAAPRKYGNKPRHGAEASRSYRCSCKGPPKVVHPDLKGGVSGKKRNRLQKKGWDAQPP